MGKIIHVISHTHWDREWYFTVDDSQILMAKGFDEVLSALENNPNIKHYMLDAQVSVLEEYLKLKPQDLTRVKALIKSGRLVTGPWYTQPDVFDIHGESIVRNLLIGMKMADELGGGMKIGYLPDTFGFNAQMPYIYSECGLDKAVIRRGYDPKIHGKTEFIWKGLDGESSVRTSVQPFGYSMGHPRRGARYRDFSLDALVQQTYPLLEKVKELSSSNHVMLTIGGDQVSVDDQFDQFVELLQKNSKTDDIFIQSSLEEYFDALEKDLPLDHYTGEFRSPRYARVHRTIESSRYDIKRANYLAEQALLRYAEPINAISKELGLYHDDENIERAWKLILESHAHDSMGGCNSDQTNEIVLSRCIRAKHIADGVFYHQARLLTRNISKNDSESVITVFNSSTLDNAFGAELNVLSETPNFCLQDDKGNSILYSIISQKSIKKARKIIYTSEGERESNVEEYFYETKIRLHDCPVPVLGYQALRLYPSDKSALKLNQISGESIENDRYKVTFVQGTINFEDKLRHIHYDDFISFEDVADDGDLYDFSPLKNDNQITNTNVKLNKIEGSDIEQTMNLTYTLNLPVRINSERTKRVTDTVKQIINVRLRLVNGQNLRIDADLTNKALDHRLRLLFHTDIESTTSYSSLPFGIIKRDKESIPENWHESYDEYPANIEPFSGIVSIRDKQKNLTIFAKGNKEYEIIQPGVIAITLFRSVGAIGKSDLVYRPGRESGRCVAAPESQLLKELSFNLGLLSDSVDSKLGSRISKESEQFSNPFKAYQAQELKRDFQQMDYFDIFVPKAFCPNEFSLVKNIPDGLMFSSIMQYNKKTMLRLTNISGNTINVESEKVVEGSRITNFIGTKFELSKKVPTNSAVTIIQD